MPLVSVILPTYNRTGTLPAAAMSVLTQSFRDLELIIVDDASSEDIGALVAAIPDKRIRYLRHDRNGGAAMARNTGIDHAQGRYIAFQDSDDVWLPQKLERQVAKLAALPPDVGVVTAARIVYSRVWSAYGGAGKVHLSPPSRGRLELDGDQVRRLLVENRLSLQNALFRRECFCAGLRFDPLARANEDWDLAIKLAMRWKIVEDAEVVTLSTTSDDSISSDLRRLISGGIRILKNNRAVLRKYPSETCFLYLTVAVRLWKIGKRKAARRFLAASLRTSPASTRFISQITFRMLGARAARLLLPQSGHTRTEL